MGYLKNLFEKNFLEYASYVIKERAIPHINDGLKPVQRRILHSLMEMDDGKFNKVANVVGNSMKYHPHGDMSIYSALVVLANRDLFIEKQGNFGNVFTGDVAAAGRYIECRLLPLAKEVLFNPEITEYIDSYDGRNREPVTFPAKIPVLLAMGGEGIAVGMATKILPHNLIELMDAQICALKGKPFTLYPDFASGGQMDVSNYDDGNGNVLVRAQLDTSDPKRIVVRGLPYGVTTSSLIESIDQAAKKGKLKIAAVNDYTAEAVEIDIHLARGVHTQDTVDALYAYTDCEVSISTSMTIIRDNKPVVSTATEVVKHSADQLQSVLAAELKIEQGHLNDRLHAKTLEQIFIENRIYKAIEKMTTQEKVTKAVLDGLKPFKSKIRRDVTGEDVERLLKIPIRRISLYDINKAKKEMTDIRARLKEIKAHLADITGYATGFLKGLIKKYKDDHVRRTEIESFERVDVREVAKRDLKLRYDRKTGYLGYEANGDALFDVSTFDKVLVIRKSGLWSVVSAPDKLFVDKGMLFCGFIEEGRVFTVVYRDAKSGCPYIKRCRIEKFIMNKGYELVPEGSRIYSLTTDEDLLVDATYKPKPRVRVLNERFKVADFPVRGNKAGGIRLAKRDVSYMKFVKAGAGDEDSSGQTKLF